MQAVLTHLGVGLPDLRITATVPEALQTFSSWQPQIVFVDLELRPPPDRPSLPKGALNGLPKNGVELVRFLLERDPDLQVIVCSATEPEVTAVAPLLREGRIQGMVKPVVAAKVQAVLAKAAAARDQAVTPRRSAMA
jgi:ActR/RegA family two-component response regulator